MAATEKLADALSKAQTEFKPALKERQGQVGNQKYDYADLASINDATKAALAKHGLCVTSKTVLSGNQLVMETSLIHGPSGERETAVWPLVSGTQQQMGSAATYARRYTICALLNVVGETDDDGEAATSAGNTNIPKTKAEPEMPFELVTGEGEIMRYARGGEYLAGIELAFSEATDKAGFWETNAKHFAEWQVKFKGKPAGEQFNRVGRMISEAIGASDAA